MSTSRLTSPRGCSAGAAPGRPAPRQVPPPQEHRHEPSSRPPPGGGCRRGARSSSARPSTPGAPSESAGRCGPPRASSRGSGPRTGRSKRVPLKVTRRSNSARPGGIAAGYGPGRTGACSGRRRGPPPSPRGPARRCRWSRCPDTRSGAESGGRGASAPRPGAGRRNRRRPQGGPGNLELPLKPVQAVPGQAPNPPGGQKILPGGQPLGQKWASRRGPTPGR